MAITNGPHGAGLTVRGSSRNCQRAALQPTKQSMYLPTLVGRGGSDPCPLPCRMGFQWAEHVPEVAPKVVTGHDDAMRPVGFAGEGPPLEAPRYPPDGIGPIVGPGNLHPNIYTWGCM